MPQRGPTVARVDGCGLRGRLHHRQSVGRMSAADKRQRWRWPSGRRVTRLLMGGADTLAEADRAFVARLLHEVPPLAAAVAAAQRLSLLLRRQSSEKLDDVLTAASATPLANFTAELRKDIDAV